MGVLGNPFKLFRRLLIASFKITGYTITLIAQILWYIFHKRTDRIADAFGEYGLVVTDAIADVFRD